MFRVRQEDRLVLGDKLAVKSLDDQTLRCRRERDGSPLEHADLACHADAADLLAVGEEGLDGGAKLGCQLVHAPESSPNVQVSWTGCRSGRGYGSCVADTPKTADDVKKIVSEQDVRFIRLWFTDVLGQLKSFSINSSELDDAFEGGMGFDGSSITGFNPIEESDMIAMPDPSTFAVLPWRPEENATARMFCDVQVPGGEPYEGDPRWIMRRALERAKEMGFEAYNIGPELEFFYFAESRPESGVPQVMDEGGYFDLTTLDAGSEVRRDTILALEQLGIHVEYAHHEVGPSQHEVDMRYKDALDMADDCMTYRIVVKEYAMNHGMHATFMPKPLSGENGSGMHVHQSLQADGKNAFFDPDDQFFLSDTAKAFIAGQLRHAREISPLFAQWVNSYKRLVPGLRGAGLSGVVAAQPLSTHPRAALPPGQGRRDSRRAPLSRPRLQSVPLLRRHAPRRPRGNREGLRAARADGAEPLPPDP